MRNTTIIAFALALCGVSVGQDFQGAARGRAFGDARTADGAPWAEAEVHFLHRSWTFWAEDEVGHLDHVVVRSSADGRFNAELLPGRTYRCWAAAELDGARVRFSTAVVAAKAGERIELVAGEPTGPTVIEIEGFDDVADLDVRAIESGAASRNLDVVRRERGTYVLPPTPTRSVTLHVLGPGRQPLLRASVTADGATHTIAPGTGSWHRIRVFDLDAEKPIAGARIVWNEQGRHLELARTGADGTAALDLSFLSAVVDGAEKRAGAHRLAVLADGWHLGMVPLENVTAGRPTRAALEADDRIDSECRPQRIPVTGIAGRLLVGGDPAAHWPLLVTATAWHRDDASSTTGTGEVMVVRTGGDGVFRLDGLSDGDEPFDVVFGAAELRALPESWRRGLPARLSVPLPRGKGDPVDLDLLEDFRVVDVQVTGHADGMPVENATVRYGAAQGTGLADARTDRVGRARLLIWTRTDEPLYVSTGGDHGWAVVEIMPIRLGKEPTDRPVRIPLELRAPIVVRGLIERPDGVPPDAHCWVSPNVDWNTIPPAGIQKRAGPTDAVFELVAPDRIPPAVLGNLAEGRSFEGNTFELRLPALPASWQVFVWLSHDGTSYRGGTPVTLAGDETSIEVEIDVQRQ